MSFFKHHPIVTGSAVFIGLSLILVILIQWTDQGSFGMGHRQIGLIEVNGMILDPLPVVEQIQTMEQLDHVLGVILRFESPGGIVAASQEIHSPELITQEQTGLCISRKRCCLRRILHRLWNGQDHRQRRYFDRKYRGLARMGKLGGTG